MTKKPKSMITILLFVFAIFLTLIFFGRNIYNFTFPSYKEQVANLLTGLPTAWLKDARVEAWQPSSDYYPMKYYILLRINHEEYSMLVKSFNATIKEDNFIKPFFRLDDSISFPEWAKNDTQSVVESSEAKIPHGVVYFRYIDGNLYAVVMRRGE